MLAMSEASQDYRHLTKGVENRALMLYRWRWMLIEAGLPHYPYGYLAGAFVAALQWFGPCCSVTPCSASSVGLDVWKEGPVGSGRSTRGSVGGDALTVMHGGRN